MGDDEECTAEYPFGMLTGSMVVCSVIILFVEGSRFSK